MDSIRLSDCVSNTKLAITSNSGLYLEGLTVLANFTNSPALADAYVSIVSRVLSLIVLAERTALLGIPLLQLRGQTLMESLLKVVIQEKAMTSWSHR